MRLSRLTFSSLLASLLFLPCQNPEALAKSRTLAGWVPVAKSFVQIYRINPENGENTELLEIRRANRDGFIRFTPSRHYPTRILWFEPSGHCAVNGSPASYSAVVLDPAASDSPVRIDFASTLRDDRALFLFRKQNHRQSWSSLYPPAVRWTNSIFGRTAKVRRAGRILSANERVLARLARWIGGKAWDAGSVLAQDLSDGKADGRSDGRPLTLCGHPAPAVMGTSYWREAVREVTAGNHTGLTSSQKMRLEKTSIRVGRLANGMDGRWEKVLPMLTARDSVLVVSSPSVPPTVIGGETNQGISSAVERYDPVTRRWIRLPSYPLGVAYASGSALPDGKIFVTGGFNSQGFTNHTYVFHPRSGKWEPVANAPVERAASTSVLLPDGEILVTGGEDNHGVTARTDRYDIVRNRWQREKDAPVGRLGSVGVLLPDGSVWIGEGSLKTGGITDRGFFYNPRSRDWSDAPPSPTPRLYATAALLPDGSLMVLDGFNRSGVLDSADVLGPNHRWKTFVSRDLVKRKETGAALLPDGSLLLVGGEDPSGNSIDTATRLH